MYSAIEEASGLLNITCSPDTVRPILDTFEPFGGGVVFGAPAGEGHDGLAHRP